MRTFDSVVLQDAELETFCQNKKQVCVFALWGATI